jgi:hypothetical protein
MRYAYFHKTNLNSNFYCKQLITINQVNEGSLKKINEFCEPILQEPAFKRLNEITFLGVLSPRFDSLMPDCKYKPVWNYKKLYNDGTRKDHSLGVASIILDQVEFFKFNERNKRIAICWALLHDIATWPLSHTGEPAFSSVTKISSRKLREMMILGSNHLPDSLSISKSIRKLGIDPTEFIELFNKEQSPSDKDLKKLWFLIHSPISPDTIEGMWRTGYVYHIKFPHAVDYHNKIQLNLFEPYIEKSDSSVFIAFWKSKSKVYSEHINSNSTLLWESAWSNSIKKYYSNVKLIDSLNFTETDIISTIVKNGIEFGSELNKYKEPQQYFVKNNKRKFDTINLSLLGEYLSKRDIHAELRTLQRTSKIEHLRSVTESK